MKIRLLFSIFILCGAFIISDVWAFEPGDQFSGRWFMNANRYTFWLTIIQDGVELQGAISNVNITINNLNSIDDRVIVFQRQLSDGQIQYYYGYLFDDNTIGGYFRQNGVLFPWCANRYINL